METVVIALEELAHYAEIEDWNVRRRVLFAFYNYAVILVNGRQCYEKEKETSYRHQHDIIRAADEAIAAYDNPVVRSMDGDKYDLDGLKEELLYDVFGNWICGCDQRDDMVPEMLERCCRLLDGLYQDALKESLQAHPGKGEDSLEVACGIQDEIYCNYWKAKVYLEKIGLEEYLHKMMEYFEVTRNDFGEETTAIVDSRGYQINMYHLVNLAGTPGLAEHTELLEKIGQFILPRFTEFVEKLPRNDRATFVNGTVRSALMELFRTLGTKHVDAYYFLNMLMNRDEISLMHSILVERLALVLLRHVMNEKPGLLVGMRNTANVVEVLEKRGEFEKCAEESFDCVMCGVCSSRCPAGISHPQVAMLARRLNGKYLAPKSEHLENRVREIENGTFDELMEALMGKPASELQELYNNRDIEK